MALRLPKPNHWVIAILITVFLLRLPSFFEPYWYGDEGIYLAIGQAMQRGAVLYRDIWDNKPPLLYSIYAISPTLLWAKFTATIFVLGTVVFTYKIAKKYLAALLAGVLLSIPFLEGTIANAELYFTLPIAIAALYFLREKINPLAIGLLFSAAFLLKVPAVLDFLGLFLAYFLISHQVKPFIKIAAVFVGVMIPTVSYFYFNHALADFLIASFSQNASYVAVGTGPLSKLSNPLFVKGLLLIFGCAILWFFYLKKKITKELLLLSFWFGFSLYGALLSNRPYLHYLLQVIPPGVILLFYLLSNLRRYALFAICYVLVIFVLARMFSGGFALDSKAYYTNWWDYLSERKSWSEYINFFDSRTTNSYAIARYLKQNSSPTDPIFVWGDASAVYALPNRPAAAKFIQAHHLTTINPKNYDLVISRLQKYQPKFIIISRPVHFPFPKLEEFVKNSYSAVTAFGDLYVYQNIIPANPPKFNVNY